MSLDTRDRYEKLIDNFIDEYDIDSDELKTLLTHMYVVNRVAKVDIAYKLGISNGLTEYMLKTRFGIIGDNGVAEAAIAYNYNIDVKDVKDFLLNIKSLGITYSDICNTAEINKNSLDILMDRYGIYKDSSVKTKARAIMCTYDLEWYKEMHINRGFSPAKIGSMLKINEKTVRSHLEELGIFTMRDRRGYNEYGYKVSSEWLHKVLIVESKSRQEIADMLGVGQDTVTKYIQRNGIKK